MIQVSSTVFWVVQIDDWRTAVSKHPIDNLEVLRPGPIFLQNPAEYFYKRFWKEMIAQMKKEILM